MKTLILFSILWFLDPDINCGWYYLNGYSSEASRAHDYDPDGSGGPLAGFTVTCDGPTTVVSHDQESLVQVRHKGQWPQLNTCRQLVMIQLVNMTGVGK